MRGWWRKGPRTDDAPEIWIVRAGPDAGGYRRLTTYPGKDAWPIWAPDGKGLYSVSDEGGTDKIWYQSIEDGDRRKIMGFEEGRVTWPAIAARAGVIVFERAFGIWCLAPGGKPEAVPIHAVADEKVGTERKTFTDGATEFALSPDGRKLAFVVHGEIFAMPAGPAEEAEGRGESAPAGGTAPAFRVTRTAARESGIAWLPDSRRIAYSSERDGDPDLYLYDFVMREDFPFIQGPFPDDELQGLAAMAWSPDGRWLAAIDMDRGFFKNLVVKAIDGDRARPITFLPHIEGIGPQWSPDGRFIVFGTGQYRYDMRAGGEAGAGPTRGPRREAGDAPGEEAAHAIGTRAPRRP